MVHSFACIGAALGAAVEDVYTQNRRLSERLREKGSKRHAMPHHRNFEEYVIACHDDAGLITIERQAELRAREGKGNRHCCLHTSLQRDPPPQRRGPRVPFRTQQEFYRVVLKYKETHDD
jgi:hypothetical protein